METRDTLYVLIVGVFCFDEGQGKRNSLTSYFEKVPELWYSRWYVEVREEPKNGEN